MNPVATSLTVFARDLWTGDVIRRHGGVICAMKPDVGHDGDDWVEIQVCDPVETAHDIFPIQMENGRWFRYKATDQLDIERDRPLPNGMHMTQFDLQGKCHGRAHPAVERQLRAEGKIADDYRHL